MSGATASAADIGAVSVLDGEGKERKLGEAWATAPAVVIWIRHFG